MNKKKTIKSGIVELSCSGKWPVNPSPITGEIPRLFYCYDTEKLISVFSDITLEREGVKFEEEDPTALAVLWNYDTIFQKWTQQGMKALCLDRYPYCAIDDATGTIFGGYASVEQGEGILESEGFRKMETDFRFYVMKEGYLVPVNTCAMNPDIRYEKEIGGSCYE